MTKVLDHGNVELLEVAGTELDIVNAARVSYGNESTEMNDKDRGLIKFLLRHEHMTPFEMVWLKWRVKAPIFVFREWHRHRTASINEMSGRYTELTNEFYVPEMARKLAGKQGNYYYEPMSGHDSRLVSSAITDASEDAWEYYRYLLNLGVAKEMARMVLPVNIYSEMIWACNLRNLLHFIELRADERAQWEIQQYAIIMMEIVFDQFPTIAKFFLEEK